MRTRLSVALAAVVLCLAVRAEAQFAAKKPSLEDYRVELGLSYWKPDPDVVFRFGPTGNDIDLITLFEVPAERFKEFRATVKPGRKHKIRVQHVDLRYAKDKTFHITGTRFNIPFDVALPASTKFNWNVWRAGYEWDVISSPSGFLGVIGELKYNHVVANVSNTPFNVTSSSDHIAAVPAIGGIARGYLSKNVSVTAETTRFKVPDKPDRRGSIIDYDVYASANLGRHLAVQAGYRSMSIDYLRDGDVDRLKMKGTYWGGSLRF